MIADVTSLIKVSRQTLVGSTANAFKLLRIGVTKTTGITLVHQLIKNLFLVDLMLIYNQRTQFLA